MPIYEYLCNSCGAKKEHIQKMSDAPVKACPECGSEEYAKQISAAGFQLKGSGWYVTDFKNKPAQPTAKSGKSDAQSTESKSSDAKTDSKTDTKAASSTSASTESKTKNPGTKTAASTD
ncbi:MAG TPA: zinc ribbon domain-containing protein [Nitrosomonas sp.]|uniref:FmdB family zinc ribbon protein n=1 Tax=Nitrosomonas sp. TaxID=42353 RepID=UPI00208110E2|nr:zinc ribbon domain-containing protein [Nitrosomonas sp.]GJL75176.1 MAG: hypothetical protein NMNS02_12820 [Nitrosomonas sp.]HNP27081.1 zinc ribbon domain-containing protein [Nitrosomonas sp.]